MERIIPADLFCSEVHGTDCRDRENSSVWNGMKPEEERICQSSSPERLSRLIALKWHMVQPDRKGNF